MGFEGHSSGDQAAEWIRAAWPHRHHGVRVRPGGRAAVLGQVVPRQQGVLPARAQRDAHHQDLPVPGPQFGREFFVLRESREEVSPSDDQSGPIPARHFANRSLPLNRRQFQSLALGRRLRTGLTKAIFDATKQERERETAGVTGLLGASAYLIRRVNARTNGVLILRK